MRIFLAGATGVIGRRLAPQLLHAGHQVVGLTRRPEAAGSLRSAGVEPAIGDALDREGLARLVAAARPDADIHELTDIPRALNVRRYAEEFAGNDRLRREGTDHLVQAALASGVKRIVAQSIAFAYAPGAAAPGATASRPAAPDPRPVKTEDDPLFDDAPEPFRRSVAALRTLERLVTETPGIDGIVLRYGLFYGPGTAYARDGHWSGEVRRRRFPIAGRGEAVASFIHVDDAAAATVAALERGRAGIYNVVDDEPAPQSEWLPHYARALGAPPPRRVPVFLVRLLAGPSPRFWRPAPSGPPTRKRGASWAGRPAIRAGDRRSGSSVLAPPIKGGQAPIKDMGACPRFFSTFPCQSGTLGSPMRTRTAPSGSGQDLEMGCERLRSPPRSGVSAPARLGRPLIRGPGRPARGEP